MIIKFAPFLASWVIRILSVTMRLEEKYPERVQRYWDENKNIIIAFWHGRLLMIPCVYRGKGVKILISRHGDGELIARTMERMGYDAIRGSTKKGGVAALRNMVRAYQGGYDIAISPDGPRGPRYRVQDGLIELARLSGAPILPLSFGASKKKILKSWDAFLFPFPFSRGIFFWGEPIYVENRKDTDYFQEKKLEVERALGKITEYVDNYY